MTAADQRAPGFDWDPMDTATGIPHDIDRRLRREAPISRTRTGAWFIARQDDLLAAARDVVMPVPTSGSPSCSARRPKTSRCG